MQHRLDHAVDEELVAQDPVEVEKVEGEQLAGRIEALVGEHHRDVIGGEGGQAEARRLVAGVELVEEQVEAGEALVDVLGGEVHAVVVVPERAHGLVDVAVRPMGRIESGVLVRIVLVVERDRTRLEEVTRKPVALRGRVTVVQMRAHRVLAEPAVVGGKPVEVPDQDRRVVVRDIRRAGADAVETPDRLGWKLVRHDHTAVTLRHLIQLGRRKRQADIGSLMGAGPSFACSSVWRYRRCGSQRAHRLFDRRDWHRHREGRGGRARALARRRAGGTDGPRAQPVFRDEHACPRQQPHLEEIAAAEAGLDDLLSIEERPILRALPGRVRTGLGKIGHEHLSLATVNGSKTRLKRTTTSVGTPTSSTKGKLMLPTGDKSLNVKKL